MASSGMVKTLCVGNVYSGKTSIIRRYARNLFDENYSTTVGVDFMLKTVHAEGTEVKVQMWDIAGQDRFFGLSRAFYTHAGGAIVVFDLLERKSFEAAAKWKKDIDDKIELPNGSKIPVLLLGNKADMLAKSPDSDESPPEACASQAVIDQFVQSHGFYKYYPCSALDGTNVVTAIDDLIAEVVRRLRQPSANFKPTSADFYHNQAATSSTAQSAIVKLDNKSAASSTSGASDGKGGCC